MNWIELLKQKSKINKTAIIYTEDNRDITYRELYTNISKSASLLKSLGIKQGDRVSFISRNSPEFIYAFFATLKLGAIFNPINPDLSENELIYILKDSESIIVIADEVNYRKLINQNLPSLKYIIGTEFEGHDDIIFEKELEQHTELDETIEEDECLIMYSSGTTGNPKGIVLTQKNIFEEAFSISRHLNLNHNTVRLASLPLFFSGGLMPNVVSPLSASGTIVLSRKFSRSKFFQWLSEYKVTSTLLVPTMLSILLNPIQDLSNYNLDNLKFINTSAAPLSINLAMNFQKTYNIKIVEAYGLTENSCWCSINPLNSTKLGSIGKTMDVCEIQIINKDGKTLPANSEGEIVVKGSNIFKKYWNQPDKTSETIVNNWLQTGDLGFLDKNGYLYITGRIKELIIKGGENISPKAIDEILYQHPEVQDAATIGIPDKIYGEEIKSYITLKPKSHLSISALNIHVRKHLSEFKCPKQIEILDNIPTGPSGKLLRRALLQHHNDSIKNKT